MAPCAASTKSVAVTIAADQRKREHKADARPCIHFSIARVDNSANPMAGCECGNLVRMAILCGYEKSRHEAGFFVWRARRDSNSRPPSS